MIITEQKPFQEIGKCLKKGEKIFIIGCGECSTTCKTGGEKEVLEFIKKLKAAHFAVTGYVIPQAPCIAAHINIALAKNKKNIAAADSILMLTCGLGVQSLLENSRKQFTVHIGCNTLFMGTVDSTAKIFFEACSACGDCILETTAGLCPITQCPKSLLNGPCGGVKDGKCEADREKECIWVSIYRRLKENKSLKLLEKINPPRDFSKRKKPARRVLA